MINWTRVTELYNDFGSDGIEEVLIVFLAEVEEGMQRLATAATPDALQSEFHFLKGAALNMGFDEIAALCGQGEQLAGAGQRSTAEKARVLALLPQTCAEFSQDWHRRVGLPAE